MNPVTIVRSEIISPTGSLPKTLPPDREGSLSADHKGCLSADHKGCLSADHKGCLSAEEIINKKILITAQRGGGKSILTTNLIETAKSVIKYDYVGVVSPPEQNNPFFKNYLKDGADIYYRLNDLFLDKLPSVCKNLGHVLLILDDCIATNDKQSKEKVRQLISIPNLTMIITCQHPMYSCDTAKLFDLLLFNKTKFPSDLQRMFGYVKRVSTIDNFYEFKQIMTNMSGYSFAAFKNVKKIVIEKPKPELELDSNQYQYNLAIQEFNINILDRNNNGNNNGNYKCNHPSMVMIGSTHTNVQLVKTIISTMNKDTSGKKIDQLVVITKHNARFYEDLTESIYSTPMIIKHIMKEQTEQGDKRQHYMIVIEGTKDIINFGDCIDELLFNGRHYGISYVLAMTYPLGIVPELRANFDLVLVNAGTDKSIEMRIHDHYFGFFPCFKSFRSVYEQICNGDSGYLTVVNRGARKSLLDKIYWTQVLDNAHIAIERYPKIPIIIDQPVFTLPVNAEQNNGNESHIEKIKELMSQIKEKYHEVEKLVNELQQGVTLV